MDKNKEQEVNNQQPKNNNQQQQQTPSIKLNQPKHDYSKGARTCMTTGCNGIDFYVLASIVQQQHLQIVHSVIEEVELKEQ